MLNDVGEMCQYVSLMFNYLNLHKIIRCAQWEGCGFTPSSCVYMGFLPPTVQKHAVTSIGDSKLTIGVIDGLETCPGCVPCLHSIRTDRHLWVWRWMNRCQVIYSFLISKVRKKVTLLSFVWVRNWNDDVLWKRVFLIDTMFFFSRPNINCRNFSGTMFSPMPR